MRAVTTTEFGDVDVLRLTEVPTPTAGPGELRLQVAASGVNRADLLQRRGYYPPPPGISDIIGLEVSGTVDQVGDGVTGWSAGDAATALIAGGGYAEYVTLPAGQAAPLPPGVGLVESAAVIETAATVASNLAEAGLKAGEWCLVHGGAGGIGTFAIPYAKALGAFVATTVGSPAKAEVCRRLGADVVVDYHDDWAAPIREATGGHGIDVLLDIIGAKYLDDNVRLLARHGRMVVIGLQGGRKGTLDLNRLLTKNASVTATSLRLRPVAEKVAIIRLVVDQVWPLFASGALQVPPLKLFPIDQVAAAHSYLDSGAHVGKVVLTW
ncbi:MAG: NAD(P)H-quinone oxidoreductase [Propionibacteriaceae bacterium]|jgi:putative PIG3 family NAD(P)H quinone oxidoreductase|nr:NAD(P)H-quinone oxidoreductase [Propionibacteriaceae bacterium]